jgi:hypothetical protein
MNPTRQNQERIWGSGATVQGERLQTLNRKQASVGDESAAVVTGAFAGDDGEIASFLFLRFSSLPEPLWEWALASPRIRPSVPSPFFFGPN